MIAKGTIAPPTRRAARASSKQVSEGDRRILDTNETFNSGTSADGQSFGPKLGTVAKLGSVASWKIAASSTADKPAVVFGVQSSPVSHYYIPFSTF